jgi:hypothetical protein
MAVTPNYSWPVPVATDYVKDGWEAISDLGNAIDTTVAGLGSSGLTLIQTNTFSAQTTLTYDDVFTSTYKNYKIIITGVSSVANPNILVRLRTGTPAADITSANNYFSLMERTNSTFANSSSTGDTKAFVGYLGQLYGNVSFELFNPQQSLVKVMNSTSFNSNSTSTYNYVVSGNTLNVTSVCTGITIYPSSGNITGSIWIYGYDA